MQTSTRFSRPTLAIALLLSSACLLSGCGKKTEQEQLDEVRNSFIYKNYRLASDKGLPLTLLAYEKSESFGKQQLQNADGTSACAAAEDIAGKDTTGFVRAALGGNLDCEDASAKDNQSVEATANSTASTEPGFGVKDLCIARVFLAFGEMASDKPDLALAETDLIEASAKCNASQKQIATSLRAVIYHRKEWPGLAKAETEKVKDALGKAPDPDAAMHELLLTHAAFAGLAIRDDNWAAAGVHIDSIGLMLDAPWLGRLTNIGLAIKEKRIDDALVEIKTLSQDPSVPKEVQVSLQSFVADIEIEYGNLDGPLLMERMIMKVVWETAKSKGSEQWKALTALLDENGWGSGEQAVSSGMKVFRELVDEAKKESDKEPQPTAAPTPQ